MAPPIVTGKLAEDGQQMDFPYVAEDGSLKPLFRAMYNVYQKGFASGGYEMFTDRLVYLALPAGVTLEFQEYGIPVPFKDRDGKVLDVKGIKMSSFSITTGHDTTLAKIHPHVPFRVNAGDGTAYFSFEMLGAPAKYRDAQEVGFDFSFLPSEEKAKLRKDLAMSDWAQVERPTRVIKLPGAVIFPDYCAFRLPGWIAKEFNGSPEFGFAVGDAKEPRKGEQLHHHNGEIMEPYIGREGVIGLFVAMEGGSETYKANDEAGTEYRGEIFEVKKGDVVIPMPEVPHRILNEKSTFPYAQFTVNYAAKPGKLLSDVSNPRTAIEKA